MLGVPEIIKLDNGREFHSKSLKSAAAQLKIELRYCQPGQPHLKGRVERFFGEVARDFCAMIAGRATWRVLLERSTRPSAESSERVIVFGAGDGGMQVVRAMLSSPNSPYIPVALLDDNSDLRNLRVKSVRVVGGSDTSRK